MNYEFEPRSPVSQTVNAQASRDYAQRREMTLEERLAEVDDLLLWREASIGDPPPNPITKSQPFSFTIPAPRSIVVDLGFGST